MRIGLSRRTWLIVGLLLLAVGGGWYTYHKRYNHWAVHDPGLVYRSAWLQPYVFTELIERHQIRTVINLCEPGEMGEARWEGERAAVQGAGAQLLEMSMPRKVAATDPVVDEFVEVLSNPHNYPILVHCQHGVTRTAELLAMYDILFRRMSPEESLGRMPLFGREQHPVVVRAFVRDFAEKHRADVPRVGGSLDVLRKEIR